MMAAVPTHADGENVSSTNTKPTGSASTQRLLLGDEVSAMKVYVRVRPFSASELNKCAGELIPIVRVSPEQPSHITTLDPTKGYQSKATYIFDHCFDSASINIDNELQGISSGDGKVGGIVSNSLTSLEASTEGARNPLVLDILAREQAHVYGHVGRPLVLNALAGYNGCVFAYGQTCSGKTFTMMGPPEMFSAPSESTPEQVRAATVASAQQFCRAATAYNGVLRSAPNTNAHEAPADSRFRPSVSLTPVPHFCTPRPGSRRDTISTAGDRLSSIDESLSVRSDVALQWSHQGGCHDSRNLCRYGDDNLQGIIPRLVHDIFRDLHEKRERDSSHSFRVEVEYYEIYREKVMDLLVSGSSNVELRVRNSKAAGPYVEHLSKKHVLNEGEALRYLQRGNIRRHTASTALNDRSSRGHAIFVLHLVQMRISDENNTSAKLTSKVNLVDLAGSERTGAQCLQSNQFKEGVMINSSLTVLGRVIDALADSSSGKRNVFCPYRDSVLTWLLMGSIGGNSKTTMVATVSPHASNFDEVCQTLRYASRAKQIVTQVVVNEDPQARQIKLLTLEVQRLKELLCAEGKSVEDDDDVVTDALQERIAALEGELSETRAELERKSSELTALKASGRSSINIPSTLKASNAGVAGAAKELAKAKSDVRRLEAENLLHLQTEQELTSTTERLKKLEKKYGQLLSDSKDALDAAKKMEKEAHEKDKRITALQHQLEEQTLRVQADLLPPEDESGRASQRDSEQSLSRLSTSMSVDTAPMELAVDAKNSTKTIPKKAQKVKARSISRASPPSSAEYVDPVQFRRHGDDKRQIATQLQERTDAFRKSQLEVKRLKSEVKCRQNKLEMLEKRLHDQHAEATRRLQEELQEVRRNLKDERRHSKDLRHALTGPMEERPVFSYAYVLQDTYTEEEKWRSTIQEEESAEREYVKRAWQLTELKAPKLLQVELQYSARLAEVQRDAEQQHACFVEAQTRYTTLQEKHAELEGAKRASDDAVLSLRQQLEELSAAREAARRYQAVAAEQEEKVDALHTLVSELQESAALQAKREEKLKDEVTALEERLNQEQEQSKAALQLVEAELAEKMRKLDAAAEAMTSLKAAHAEQVQRVEAAMKAEGGEYAAVTSSQRLEIEQLNDALRKSEESRRAQVRRGIEQAREHEVALDALKAELETTKKAATAAEEAYQDERRALQLKLKQQEESRVPDVLALKEKLSEAEKQHISDRHASAVTIAELQERLAAAETERIASANTLQIEVERAVAQVANHEEAVHQLRLELEKEKEATQSVVLERASDIAMLKEQLATERKQHEEIRESLREEAVTLKSRLADFEQLHSNENTRAAEAALEQEKSLECLRAQLESAQTMHAAVERDAAHSLKALTDELEMIRPALHKSEESRRQLIQRSLEHATQQDAALEEVQRQLSELQDARTAAEKRHEEDMLKAEKQLATHQLESAETISHLKEQLHRQQESATAQLAAVSATLENQMASAKKSSIDQEKNLSEALEEAASLRTALANSEEALKAQIQRATEDSAAHARALLEARQDVERLQKEAAVAAETHSQELREWASKWEENARVSEATAQRMRTEAEAQRRADAEASAKAHTAAVDALQSTVKELRTQVGHMEASLASETERREREAIDHDKALHLLQDELRRAHLASVETTAVHKAVVEKLNNVVSAQEKAKVEEVAAVTQRLREAQKQLILSEEAHTRSNAERAEMAAMHTQSLNALRGALAAEYQQKLTSLTEKKDVEVKALQTQISENRTVTQEMQEELRDARHQLRQMVETHSCISKQMEAEKQANVHLNHLLADTQAQQKASAAAAEELKMILEEAQASIATLKAEKTEASTKLADAISALETTRARLAAVEGISEELREKVELQNLSLSSANAQMEQLRAEASLLNAQCAEMQAKQLSLIKQHQEEIIAAQVDFLADMEKEYRQKKQPSEASSQEKKKEMYSMDVSIEKQNRAPPNQKQDPPLLSNLVISEAEAAEAKTATGGGPLTNASFTSTRSSGTTPSGTGINSFFTSFWHRNSPAVPLNRSAPGGGGVFGTARPPSPQLRKPRLT